MNTSTALTNLKRGRGDIWINASDEGNYFYDAALCGWSNLEYFVYCDEATNQW